MNRLNANRIIAVILFVFSVVYIIGAFQIRQFPLPRPVDSDLFPKVLGGLLLLLSVILFFQPVRDGEIMVVEEDPGTPLWKRPWTMVAVTAVAIALYAALMVPLGFVVTSFFFVIALSVYYGYRRAAVLVPVALLVPLSLYLVLTRLMAINMPRGILPI